MAREYTLGVGMTFQHFSLQKDVSGGRARRAGAALAAGLCAAALFAVFAVAAARPAAAAATTAAPPSLPVAAAAIMDRPTGRFIFLLHANTELPMASTTKMMAARVVLDSGVSPDKVVTVGTMHLAGDESAVGLTPGEKLTVEQLLQAMLVASANDAALALAVAVGGTEQAFVARMNADAAQLGLTRTHFEDPARAGRAGPLLDRPRPQPSGADRAQRPALCGHRADDQRRAARSQRRV